MLKKILIAVGCVALVVVGCVTTFLVQNHFHKEETAQLTAQIAYLNQQWEAINPIVKCYTVRTTVRPGQQITQDMLVEQDIPQAFTNDDFCSLADILGTAKVQTEDGKVVDGLGYFAKTYIEPGTPITKSLLMAEKISDSLREIDVVANRWPIGLKEGDYVDVRLTYPRGEDVIVLSHKRVFEVNEQTLKLHMTEEEQVTYQAAIVDYYVNVENGMDIYFTKYIEPGVQDAAKTFYSIPTYIEETVNLDPNIADRAMVAVKNDMLMRQQLADEPYEKNDTRYGLIRSGRDRLNSAVNADYDVWRNEYNAEQAQQAQQDSSNTGSLIEGGVN